MSIHQLTKNFRASAAVLSTVNQNHPTATGDLTSGLPTQPDGLAACPIPPNKNIVELIKAATDAKQRTALLCRTNADCLRWQAFLESFKSQNDKSPLMGKTRRIDETPLRIHRLWAPWWFFHGYSHLHPVPKAGFDDWCRKLTGVAAHNLPCECVNYPNQKEGNTPCCKIARDTNNPAIGGRRTSHESLTVAEALAELRNEETIPHATQCTETIGKWLEKQDERFKNNDLLGYSPRLKTEWDNLLKAFEREFAPSKTMTWDEVWRWFEEYYEDDELLFQFDGIIISTVHKAKGLEFDTVFVQDWALTKDWTHVCDVSALKDKTLRPETTIWVGMNSTVAAELRIWYVALSRAKDTLYTIPTAKLPRGGNLKCLPSETFLNSAKGLHSRDLEKKWPAKPFGFRNPDPAVKDFSVVFIEPSQTLMEQEFPDIREGAICDFLSCEKFQTRNNLLNGNCPKGSRVLAIPDTQPAQVPLLPSFTKNDFGWWPLLLPVIQLNA